MSAPAVEVAQTQLADALLARGALDRAGVRRALQTAQKTREPLVAVLHQLALADDAVVTDTAAALFQIPLAKLSDIPEQPVTLSAITTSFLRRHRVLPLAQTDEGLVVAIVDPCSPDGPNALKFASHDDVTLQLIGLGDWRTAFSQLYGEEQQEATLDALSADAWSDDATRVRDHADSAPAVRLVDSLLDRALEAGASDIHIEPMADRVRIRLRVDGKLQTVSEEPPHLAAGLAARIKVLADMDVANRRAPQDGRTSLAARGRPVDVRISTVPSNFGETVALRLLRRDPQLLDIGRLGFSAEIIALLQRVILLRRGIFLVTGPTGSGKTTTLYAMIERLRTQSLKILSIEDPIEYFFSDVTQVQVNEDAGVSFSSALRSFLRQDPDVILVGEIRDGETARIAVQAALTGHLVLATLHTIDAASAIERLVDMGLDRYLVSATLTGAMAQRLVTRACPHCRQRRAMSAAEASLLGAAAGEIEVASGCASCGHTGRQGRLALAEGFLVTDALRADIAAPDRTALRRALSQAGFVDLRSAAVASTRAGDIPISEIATLDLS